MYFHLETWSDSLRWVLLGEVIMACRCLWVARSDLTWEGPGLANICRWRWSARLRGCGGLIGSLWFFCSERKEQKNMANILKGPGPMWCSHWIFTRALCSRCWFYPSSSDEKTEARSLFKITWAARTLASDLPDTRLPRLSPEATASPWMCISHEGGCVTCSHREAFSGPTWSWMTLFSFVLTPKRKLAWPLWTFFLLWHLVAFFPSSIGNSSIRFSVKITHCPSTNVTLAVSWEHIAQRTPSHSNTSRALPALVDLKFG